MEAQEYFLSEAGLLCMTYRWVTTSGVSFTEFIDSTWEVRAVGESVDLNRKTTPIGGGVNLTLDGVGWILCGTGPYGLRRTNCE